MYLAGQLASSSPSSKVMRNVSSSLMPRRHPRTQRLCSCSPSRQHAPAHPRQQDQCSCSASGQPCDGQAASGMNPSPAHFARFFAATAACRRVFLSSVARHSLSDFGRRTLNAESVAPLGLPPEPWLNPGILHTNYIQSVREQRADT